MFKHFLKSAGLVSDDVDWPLDVNDIVGFSNFFDKFMALVITKKPTFNLEKCQSELKLFNRTGDEKSQNS